MQKPILFISPLPPPHGGIATWTNEIFQYGLPDGSPLSLVDTRILGKRNIFDLNVLSFAEIFRNIKVISNLLYQLITNRPRLVHLNSSLSAVGIVRDTFCAYLAKVFRVPVLSHFHGNLPDFRAQRFFGMSGICLRMLMRLSKMNIVENTVSLAAAKDITQNMILMPNFIVDKTFDLEVKKENCQSRAIFAGGITRAKGCAEILETATRLPAIEFHLFGKMHNDMIKLFENAPRNIFSAWHD